MIKKLKTWEKTILIILIILAFIAIISGPGCGSQWILFYDKPVNGKVIEIETGKPIEGAIVVGMWRLSQFLSEGFGGYAKVIVEKTDKEGQFRIPLWITFKPWKFNSAMHELAPEIVIYKPGYKIYHSHKLERAGFPSDTAMTKEEKKAATEKYSINPAKLLRVYGDKEIWDSYLEFRSEARLNTDYYSRKQLKETLDLIKGGLSQMPNQNEKIKIDILNHVKQFEK